MQVVAPLIGRPFSDHEKKKNALDIPFVQTYHHRTKGYSDTMTQAQLTIREFPSKKFHGTVDKGKKRKGQTPY
jgi:hypothetical protein